MSSSRDWLDFWSCYCNPFQWRWVYCVAGDGRVKYDLVLSLDKSYEIWFVTKRLQFKNVPRLSRAAAFEPWKTNVDGRPGTNEDWSTEYVAVRTISIGPVLVCWSAGNCNCNCYGRPAHLWPAQHWYHSRLRDQEQLYRSSTSNLNVWNWYVSLYHSTISRTLAAGWCWVGLY